MSILRLCACLHHSLHYRLQVLSKLHYRLQVLSKLPVDTSVDSRSSCTRTRAIAAILVVAVAAAFSVFVLVLLTSRVDLTSPYSILRIFCGPHS